MAGQKNDSFPLHRAVQYRIKHKVNVLLPKMRDINQKNDKGYPVFLLACELYDHEEIFDLVLHREDIHITATNDEGDTALHILVFGGYLARLERVLQKFPDADVNVENDKGNTPLIVACKTNHLEIIKYLLSKGADVQHQNKKKYTPLHYAANNGYTECAKILIDHGAQVDAKDSYGYTPLMKACKWGFTETSELLLKRGAAININVKYMTVLTSSCYNGCVELTKLLIAAGANFRFPGPFSSALIECAKNGSLGCAKELIEAGVDVAGRMKDGRSALDVAKDNGHEDIVRLLSNK